MTADCLGEHRWHHFVADLQGLPRFAHRGHGAVCAGCCDTVATTERAGALIWLLLSKGERIALQQKEVLAFEPSLP
jgi:hypothetical protein